MARSKLSWSLIFLALYVAASITIDSTTAQSTGDFAQEAAEKAADEEFNHWKALHPKLTQECATELNRTLTTYLSSMLKETSSPNHNSTVNSTAELEQYLDEAEKNLTSCIVKSDGSLNYSASVFGFNNVFALVSLFALLFLFV